MRTPPALAIALVLSATLTMISAAEPAAKGAAPLDLSAKGVQRLEVSQSQIGFTSTRVFYTLGERHLVLVLHVDNTRKEFPVTGKVVQFADDVPPEALAKWVNNQHSDGLYPDVPQPKSVVDLPAQACRSQASKLLGQKQVLNTTYNEYRVEIELAETKANDQLQLRSFKDAVKVYVGAK